jgi:hypothetical protein
VRIILVKCRDGDSDLALLSRQVSGAELGADQVFVSNHGGLGVVAATIPGRVLPANPAPVGHELDVAVARGPPGYADQAGP